MALRQLLRTPLALSLLLTSATVHLFSRGARAHGGLSFPAPRNNHGNVDPRNWTSDGTRAGDYHSGGPCAGGTCLWFSQGCYHGCANCSHKMPGGGNYYGEPTCNTTLEPTLPEEYRTWNIGNPSRWGDWTKYHPWRSPGANPVADPCGVAGGYTKATGGGGETPQGAQQGDRGSLLPPLAGVATKWTANMPHEVGFMLGANHGGGYLYSVCPKSEPLNEKCFQGAGRQLEFVGGLHTIRYLDNRTELQIPARDVSVGTTPAGSTWRVNPIPACNCDQGFDCGGVHSTGNNYSQASYTNGSQPVPSTSCVDGYSCNKGLSCPTGTQFSVPFPYGYGQQVWDLTPAKTRKAGNPLAADTWQVVDSVRAPNEAGEYVLRWRWDVEQNPQIWSHCADITVVA